LKFPDWPVQPVVCLLVEKAFVVRLQKFLADAGVASRRAGEQVILEGRVAVNDEIVRLLGTKVDPEHDKVKVDGCAVRPKRKIYAVLHKPIGCVCSRKD
jgi:23S rRNA pseudouridine2605 synthase